MKEDRGVIPWLVWCFNEVDRVPGSSQPPYSVACLRIVQEGCLSASHHIQVSDPRLEGEKKGHAFLFNKIDFIF